VRDLGSGAPWRTCTGPIHPERRFIPEPQEDQFGYRIRRGIEFASDRMPQACQVQLNGLQQRRLFRRAWEAVRGGIAPQFFGGALSVVRRLVACELSPDRVSCSRVCQFRLAKGLEVLRFLCCRAAGRRTKFHPSELLEEREGRRISLLC